MIIFKYTHTEIYLYHWTFCKLLWKFWCFMNISWLSLLPVLSLNHSLQLWGGLFVSVIFYTDCKSVELFMYIKFSFNILCLQFSHNSVKMQIFWLEINSCRSVSIWFIYYKNLICLETINIYEFIMSFWWCVWTCCIFLEQDGVKWYCNRYSALSFSEKINVKMKLHVWFLKK